MKSFLSALSSLFETKPEKKIEFTPPVVIPSKHTYYKGVKWKDGVRDIFQLDKTTELGECFCEGHEFPKEPQTGDIFLDFDCYMYVYNMYVNENMTYTVDETMNGWSVRRITTNRPPSFTKEILSEIAGKPIVSARFALSMIDGISTNTIVIPATVTDVTGMFKGTRIMNNPTIIFKGTPTHFEECFANNNVFGIVDEKPVIHNPIYQTHIDGDCDEEVLKQIAKTTKYENVSIR